jgi:hypothetical protein
LEVGALETTAPVGTAEDARETTDLEGCAPSAGEGQEELAKPDIVDSVLGEDRPVRFSCAYSVGCGFVVS